MNQPDRVFLNSDDDINQSGEVQFHRINCQLPAQILSSTGVELLSASIPLPLPSLPDYCLVFGYSTANAATNPTVINYCCIRLLPFNFQNTLDPGIDYAYNQYIPDYPTFVELLNQAANNDNPSRNPFFTAGDVSFSLDSTNKIVMTGSNLGLYYTPLAYDDPRMALMGQNMTLPGNPFDLPLGVNTSPFVQGYNLQLRAGFVYPVSQFPNITGVIGGADTQANSYANLVYTTCVYITSSLISGQSFGSARQRNILACVPITAPMLGVCQYKNTMLNWLRAKNNTISNIEITMLDQAYKPFNIPETVPLLLEIGFKYD